MYKLSKDYKLLFTLISAGHEAVAFVDYLFGEEKKALRDVCRVRRRRPYYIGFGVRGMSYGYIDDCDRKEGETEQDLFVKECTRLNLEWVCP